MRLIIAALFLLLLATPVMAAGDGYYIGPDEGVDLRLAPRNSATISGHLDTGTDVEIIKRDRNWAKIQTPGHSSIRGWVPAGAVRKSQVATSSGSSSSSFLSSFTSLFRSPEPPRKTAVLGVRGLEGSESASVEKEATENATRMVAWMETLKVPQSEVGTFIKEGDLKP
ncbi:MAG: SH3 domain-containing protein [Mariprofundaceae bacterium]|nr:SH3 domain-containing protein [Mariprofundaceae bacterium]